MKFTRNAGYVYVSDASAEQLARIDETLSVMDPDFLYMSGVGSWDGRHHFFDRENLRFAAGLASRLGLRFKGPQLDPVKATYPYALKDYQVRAAAEILRHPTGVITSPTGSGKTAIIAEIVRQAGSHSWVLFYRQLQTARQTRAFLEQCLGEPVGYVGGSEKTFGRVTVVMVQTASGKFGKAHEMRGLLASTDGVIVDEVHLAGSAKLQQMLGRLAEGRCSCFYGLSATYPGNSLIPSWRAGQFFGLRSTVNVTQQEVEEEVDTPDTYVIEVHVPYDGPRWLEYPEEVRRAAYNNEAWNEAVAAVAHELGVLRVPCMVATENRAVHYPQLLKMLREQGLRVVELHGGVDESARPDLLRAVQEGASDVALCTTVADYGVDAPELQVFIDAGTWSDSVLRTQRVGRVRRPKNAKANISAYVTLVPDGAPRLERKGLAVVDAILRENPSYRRLVAYGKTGAVSTIRRLFA